MTTSRRAVLRALDAATEADGDRTVSVECVAAAINADEAIVRRHLAGLAACHLAKVDDKGQARVTITGEELLALDVEGQVIIGTANECGG
ncbi:MAG: hypothetical protein ABEH64_11730 [Salinirussus sp.]